MFCEKEKPGGRRKQDYTSRDIYRKLAVYLLDIYTLELSLKSGKPNHIVAPSLLRYNNPNASAKLSSSSRPVRGAYQFSARPCRQFEVESERALFSCQVFVWFEWYEIEFIARLDGR